MPSMTDLLARAVPDPSRLRWTNGGAQLALAIHCIMVDRGFRLLDEDSRPLRDAWQLIPEWESKIPNAWVFIYFSPNCANRFRLQCTLHPGSGRVFVHASEILSTGQPLQDNIAVLGLQLDRYCASTTPPAGAGWPELLHNGEALEAAVLQYVVNPLLERAAKGDPQWSGAPGAGSGVQAWTKSGSAALAAAAVAAAAALAAALLWRQRRHTT